MEIIYLIWMRITRGKSQGLRFRNKWGFPGDEIVAGSCQQGYNHGDKAFLGTGSRVARPRQKVEAGVCWVDSVEVAYDTN